jgi:hypothetical protein
VGRVRENGAGFPDGAMSDLQHCENAIAASKGDVLFHLDQLPSVLGLGPAEALDAFLTRLCALREMLQCSGI